MQTRDGEVVIPSDTDWLCSETVVRFSNIYDGEVLDLTADCSREYAVKACPDMGYDRVTERLSLPVCWNGDVFSVDDGQRLKERFPAVGSLMLGRGLIANPALARQLRGGAPLQASELRQFHDGLLEDYCACILGEVNVLHKMKELWNYWACLFPEDKKGLKEVRKAKRLSDYRGAAAAVLAAQPAENGAYTPELG